MINQLHALWHRPQKGWDPVPEEHSRCYAQHSQEAMEEDLAPMLEAQVGGLQGKRVLDLGGGPGQYAIEFARRGAQVVWHDVSRGYLNMTRARAESAGLSIEFSVGYLEEARRFRECPFDLVFVRQCWCYSMDDARFAALVYSLVKPGGAAYIDSPTPEFSHPRGLRRVQYWLNGTLGIKIGHPWARHGRVAGLLSRFPMEYVALDYRSPLTDKILFVRSRE